MNQKDIITSSILIIIGIVLIIAPFITELKRSLILLGIVPLWMGVYFIFNTLQNNKENKDQIN
ncbi:MAG: hypothetical protein CMG41_00555 [Candidatus Marinimicrobia bacterium]|nr:hypothetical protein [Candidatus Neomarinimicrobiota bacterium]|tara:strand:- start:103 stop:291 length:189 start_codon:yes stop_codon:yes gene_type:complete